MAHSPRRWSRAVPSAAIWRRSGHVNRRRAGRRRPLSAGLGGRKRAAARNANSTLLASNAGAHLVALDAALRRRLQPGAVVTGRKRTANGRRMRRTKDRKPLDFQAAEVGRLAEAAADAAGACLGGRRVVIGYTADS
jgi:hypothetical protein